jgi:hypothetical protein
MKIKMHSHLGVKKINLDGVIKRRGMTIPLSPSCLAKLIILKTYRSNVHAIPHHYLLLPNDSADYCSPSDFNMRSEYPNLHCKHPLTHLPPNTIPGDDPSMKGYGKNVGFPEIVLRFTGVTIMLVAKRLGEWRIL